VTKEGQHVFYPSEEKPQTWRALAVFADRSERLLYLGRSTTQVRAGYAGAYEELLDEDEKARVCGISLQCWHGAPDRGHWIPKTILGLPSAAKTTLSA
jgi:hypothetical protein